MNRRRKSRYTNKFNEKGGTQKILETRILNDTEVNNSKKKRSIKREETKSVI